MKNYNQFEVVNVTVLFLIIRNNTIIHFERLREFVPLAKIVGDSYNVDPVLLLAVMWKESKGVSGAIRYEPAYGNVQEMYKYSQEVQKIEGITYTQVTEEQFQKHSWGLMQVMGGTARWLGFRGLPADLYSPAGSVTYGAKYLSRLLNQYNSLPDAIASYNAGNPKPYHDTNHRLHKSVRQYVMDVLLVVWCANVALTAVSSILDKIKDKTDTDADNKASDFLHKWLPKVQSIIDWLTGNKAH